ncbi:PREDICTED: basic proline-rich protein-like [Elephantulus edwardii]|uniref:basic proline-rich protein-like n=1 Tax=Elephantulus edwardii TaxID=28737 RepID=UPI0003F0E184|nr:PREDICTED: basic proline-rich protein-like [Elephantulus edwardii]
MTEQIEKLRYISSTGHITSRKDIPLETKGIPPTPFTLSKEKIPTEKDVSKNPAKAAIKESLNSARGRVSRKGSGTAGRSRNLEAGKSLDWPRGVAPKLARVLPLLSSRRTHPSPGSDLPSRAGAPTPAFRPPTQPAAASTAVDAWAARTLDGNPPAGVKGPASGTRSRRPNSPEYSILRSGRRRQVHTYGRCPRGLALTAPIPQRPLTPGQKPPPTPLQPPPPPRREPQPRPLSLTPLAQPRPARRGQADWPALLGGGDSRPGAGGVAAGFWDGL